jgi:S1-C subfamily serine protease
MFTVWQPKANRDSVLAAVNAGRKICSGCDNEIFSSDAQFCPKCGYELCDASELEPLHHSRRIGTAGFVIAAIILVIGVLIFGEFFAPNKSVEKRNVSSNSPATPATPATPANQNIVASSTKVMTPVQIFEQVSPSIVVVDILNANGKHIGLGSGAVIGIGQVITNCHVATKGKKLQVRRSEDTFDATLQYADISRDLCQLSVPDLNAPPVTMQTTSLLKVGQKVYAIGAPEGLELTLSEGIISSLRPYEDSQFIQTSAPISRGSSGGGLFDNHGRLIGITTFQFANGQNLNFALPVDWITELPLRTQNHAGKK